MKIYVNGSNMNLQQYVTKMEAMEATVAEVEADLEGLHENINTITYNSNSMILYPFFESNSNGEQGVNMYISNDGYTLKKINYIK